jgi:hypothetical protein
MEEWMKEETQSSREAVVVVVLAVLGLQQLQNVQNFEGQVVQKMLVLGLHLLDRVFLPRPIMLH